MASLQKIAAFCDKRTRRHEIKDFKGAYNGLQFENTGGIQKVGASVDAGLIPFQKAVDSNVDLLIVHHGMYWSPLQPITGVKFQKVNTLLNGGLAVYSSHLPLDCHSEIGNNALLAKEIGLQPTGTFLDYEGTDIGLITEGISRLDLIEKLQKTFDDKVQSIEFGSEKPNKIAILTGSGSSAVSELKRIGVDTLITGELRQNHYNQAQEEGLNLYLCGHYATEVYGVCALAKEISQKFEIPWEFIATDCPL